MFGLSFPGESELYLGFLCSCVGTGAINKLSSVCRSSGTPHTCKTLKKTSRRTSEEGLSRSLCTGEFNPTIYFVLILGVKTKYLGSFTDSKQTWD